MGSETYGDYRIGESNTTNIWDIEFPKAPIRIFECHAQAPCLKYNPREMTCIMTGLVTGEIAVYDDRSNINTPHTISKRENSHHDQINDINFYTSKTNTEFFSVSSAGELFCWDLRYMEEPIDAVFLDCQEFSENTKKSFGINCLEYESSIPSKLGIGN